MLGTSKSIWGFVPTSVPGCTLWLDGADNNSMNSASAVTVWNDKSGNSNNVTGSGTWSGGTMVFNGSTNAFSNTGFAFPNTEYSMFAVYSNTTAPTAAAYMNAVYGNGGFPMLGTFGSNKFVSARSVVANTGALGATVGWAARIAGTGSDTGFGIATDSSGNVLVTGRYTSAVTIYNQGAAGTSNVTLPFTGGQDVFVAKYNSIGDVQWAARIGGASTDTGYGIASDSSGNVFVTGLYAAALTVYNQGAGGAGVVTLPFTSGNDVFIAKYNSIGDVQWAARMAGNTEIGYGIATDSSGNVFVTGQYTGLLTIYNQGAAGTSNVTLNNAGLQDCFVAKYNSVGDVQWAARIASTGNDNGFGIATDSSGNVFVTGQYNSAVTIYNQGAAGTSNVTLPFTSGSTFDCFVAKYNSVGDVQWAARIAAAGTENGTGIATDSSGNVFVTGQYSVVPVTIYNQGAAGTSNVTLPFTSGGSYDVFIAKYNSIGDVQWAARIAGAGNDVGQAIATDTSGNVLVTGRYGAALTIYNQGAAGTSNVTLPFTALSECFIAKYNSIGDVQWAARIAGTGSDDGYGIATDSSGNVFVTGQYNSAVTIYNQGASGTAGITLPITGSYDVFIAKYNKDGFITAPIPANSNVLVDATYLPSTMSPFANGTACTTLAGSTLAATGVFVGGPSNYFNGTISEVLVYNNTLTATQRQAVEGYLAYKWSIQSNLPTTQLYYSRPPFNRVFTPADIPGCSVWMDGGDNSTMNSTTAVTVWNDKSGNAFNMTGSGTWSGSNMVFNGSTNAFSNTGYVFPISAYSLFAVYSNTTAPAAAAYMNLMYGANGFPMLGTFGVNKDVSARSVVANTGALTTNPGWVARIGSATGTDSGNAIATDSSGNVFVTGSYTIAGPTFYNQGSAGTAFTSLGFTGGQDAFVVKYSPAGAVLWVASIASSGTSNDAGYAIATDSSGNVVVCGDFGNSTLSVFSGNGSGATTVPGPQGTTNCFVAKYSPVGAILWAARIGSGGSTNGRGIATDSSGDVFITGYYNGAGPTFYNQGPAGTSNVTLPLAGTQNCFTAKYSSAGQVLWAARAGTAGGSAQGNEIATDSSGNVLVTGTHVTAGIVIYNQGASGTSAVTLGIRGQNECFLAKYSSAGAVIWAARVGTVGNDVGNGIAADPSGNVLVMGYYTGAAIIYNQGSAGTSGATLPHTGNADSFIAKYSSDGAVIWAARIASTGTVGDEFGYGLATDSLGNVLVTGVSSVNGVLTVYNAGGTVAAATLAGSTGYDGWVAKYSPDGLVLWATRISATGNEFVNGIATDSLGNVLITGTYNTASTVFYNTDGTTGITLPIIGGQDCFIVKYSSDGYITARTPANSNVLVDATYLPSTMSPFVNGTAATTLAGTTLATTGLYLGGPSNYFNGTLSELIIYASTLTSGQRQQVEGYLAAKWGLRSSLISTQPYKILPPATSV